MYLRLTSIGQMTWWNIFLPLKMMLLFIFDLFKMFLFQTVVNLKLLDRYR